MIFITRIGHGQTLDNINGVTSGHGDPELTEAGFQKALERKAEYADKDFDFVLCSDRKRAHDFAKIAFGDRIPIIADARLRSVDYGELTGGQREEVRSVRTDHINTPFPGGECYVQAIARVKEFFDEFKQKHDGARVVCISHLATPLMFEHYLHNVPLEDMLSYPPKTKPGFYFEY